MLVGVLSGLLTCALWGLTFVAARAVEPFSAWDLTMLRYGSFGVASLLFMLVPRFRPDRRIRPLIGPGLLLGAAGYVGYFLCVAYSVKLAGAAVAPLVIGAMPVLAALIGNWRERAVPWSGLAAPLGLIAAGILAVNLAVLDGAAPGARGPVLAGSLLAAVALAIWLTYALVNAAVMRAADAPDAIHWTALQGVGAAVGSLALLPLSSFGTVAAAHPEAVAGFLAWGLGLGIGGSFFASWLWAFASRRLPLTLAAQLIVTETLFGLGFGFLFEERWPTAAEWAGSALLVVGVSAGIRAFGRRAPAALPA